MQFPHPLHEFMPYGAPDLLRSGRAHLSRALVLSSSAAGLAFAALLLVIPFVPKSPVAIVPEIAFAPHDLLAGVTPHRPQPAPRAREARTYTQGAKVKPVERKEETTIVDDRRGESTVGSKEGNDGVTPESRDSGGGGTVEPTVDPDAPVAVFDTPPTAMTKVTPDYPDFARQTMVEGRVVVLILIGRDGRVREARVDERQHVPLLDEAALEAAKKWVFSPAQVNGHAVSVWSAIPFSFRLQ